MCYEYVYITDMYMYVCYYVIMKVILFCCLADQLSEILNISVGQYLYLYQIFLNNVLKKIHTFNFIVIYIYIYITGRSHFRLPSLLWLNNVVRYFNSKIILYVIL